jgi:type II secretory pathway pseudopilin PulG
VNEFSEVQSFDFQSNSGGFALAEFLVATVILAVLSTWIFGVLMDVQKAAAQRLGLDAAMENARMAMDAVTRVIRQAGNDPLAAGFTPLTACGNTELRVRSDLTGSGGPSDPDKGDPDGDTSDSGEDVTIRFNAPAGTLEFVPDGGVAQAVAGQISRFSIKYWDAYGSVAAHCDEARRVSLSITSFSAQADPRTGRQFSITVNSDIRLAGLH